VVFLPLAFVVQRFGKIRIEVLNAHVMGKHSPRSSVDDGESGTPARGIPLRLVSSFPATGARPGMDERPALRHSWRVRRRRGIIRERAIHLNET
jgi:hypothetical protein